MWWGDVLSVFVGLVVGLVTGFYFEHRATREARRQTQELEDELKALREGIYTVGGHLPVAKRSEPPPEALLHEIRKWITSYQDPQGRVPRGRLVSHFVSKGHSGRDVEVSIEALAQSGDVDLMERWVGLK